MPLTSPRQIAARLRDSFVSLRNGSTRLLLDTPVEILLGAVALGSVAGVTSYNSNKAKELEIPIAFSEVEHITKSYQDRGLPVPALTRFYAVNNDVAMKVFESSNIALRKGDDPKLFAYELRTRVEKGLSEHALISDYAAEMPESAAAARRTLDPVYAASLRMQSIRDAFAKSWSEDHDDHYHTEFYTTQSCTSGPNNTQSCTTQVHSRQVYDYTDHTYTYHPQQGRRAQELLNAYVADMNGLQKPEDLSLATEIHAANLEVITRSMKDMLEGKVPSPKQALDYANTWARGSTYNKYLPDVLRQHRALMQSAASWNAMIGQARSTSYRTYSSYDSGPKTYQVTEGAAREAAQMASSANRIFTGVKFSSTAVPQLDRDIRAFVDVALYGKPGKPEEMRADILKLARDIYNKNHENGFDVDPFSWPEVMLFTFLGLLAGAALGFGADRVIAMPSIREMMERSMRPREKRAEAIAPAEPVAPPPVAPPPITPPVVMPDARPDLSRVPPPPPTPKPPRAKRKKMDL